MGLLGSLVIPLSRLGWVRVCILTSVPRLSFPRTHHSWFIWCFIWACSLGVKPRVPQRYSYKGNTSGCRTHSFCSRSSVGEPSVDSETVCAAGVESFAGRWSRWWMRGPACCLFFGRNMFLVGRVVMVPSSPLPPERLSFLTTSLGLV